MEELFKATANIIATLGMASETAGRTFRLAVLIVVTTCSAVAGLALVAATLNHILG